jgi:hypothetical protein
MDDDDKQPFDLDSPQAIREMNERQAKLGALAQEVARAALAELKRKMERNEPLNLSADEAKDLLTVGVRMERAALGLREPSDDPEGQPLLEGYPPKRPN